MASIFGGTPTTLSGDAEAQRRLDLIAAFFGPEPSAAVSSVPSVPLPVRTGFDDRGGGGETGGPAGDTGSISDLSNENVGRAIGAGLGLAGFGGFGFSSIGGAIGAGLDANTAGQRLGALGVKDTISGLDAALSSISMGAFGEDVESQFSRAISAHFGRRTSITAQPTMTALEISQIKERPPAAAPAFNPRPTIGPGATQAAKNTTTSAFGSPLGGNQGGGEGTGGGGSGTGGTGAGQGPGGNQGKR